MGRVSSFWELHFLPAAARLYKNKYLQAVRHSFFMIMPFLLAVSLLDILESVVLDPWGLVMGGQGLNFGFWLTGGLSGDEYGRTNLVKALLACRGIIGVGYWIVSALLAMSLAGKLADIWRSDRYMTMFCAAAAFLFLVSADFVEQAALADYFAERRMFSAFFSAFLSARVFSFLSQKKILRISAPTYLPVKMSRHLSYTVPILLTLLLFALISALIMLVGVSGEDVLRRLIPPYVFQEKFFVVFYQLVVWLLWWRGIPGYNFTAVIQNAAYVPAQTGNQLGDTAAIFTAGFFEAGTMHVLGLLIAIIVFSRHEAWRSVSKFSLPMMIFNVQEPFVFGLPVVLNPIFLIPYVLAPLANTFVGWIAISWGIVPVFKVAIPWTMPIILSGTIGTNSFMGGVLQVVWLIMDIFIYAPFVIIANMADFQSEKEDGDAS